MNRRATRLTSRQVKKELGGLWMKGEAQTSGRDEPDAGIQEKREGGGRESAEQGKK